MWVLPPVAKSGSLSEEERKNPFASDRGREKADIFQHVQSMLFLASFVLRKPFLPEPDLKGFIRTWLAWGKGKNPTSIPSHHPVPPEGPEGGWEKEFWGHIPGAQEHSKNCGMLPFLPYLTTMSLTAYLPEFSLSSKSYTAVKKKITNKAYRNINNMVLRDGANIRTILEHDKDIEIIRLGT